MASENIKAVLAALRSDGFMCSGCDKCKRKLCTVQERTLLSQGFDRGNYGNAYESRDWESWAQRNRFEERSESYRSGMLLGFFSSYELHEISDEEIRDHVAALREQHPEHS